jgi:hypothetical protein
MSTTDFTGAYLDPGIYIDEIQSPVLTAAAVVPSVIGLVGDTQRARVYTEIKQIPNPLATPGTPTLQASTTGGSLAAGEQSYRVSALNAQGETDVSTAGTVTTTGTSSTVAVSWGAVVGATGYRIYGRTAGAELLIATVGSVLSYVDTGSVTPAGALPTGNTTTPIRLTKTGIDVSTLAVKDRFTGVDYTSPLDYTITTTLGTDSGTADDVTYLALADPESYALVVGGVAGTFSLTFEGRTTTALDFDATDDDVLAALEALSNLDEGEVLVTGTSVATPGLEITFVGRDAGVVPTFTAVGAGGATPTITTNAGSRIVDSDYLTITYSYTDPEYYKVTHFTDYDTVRDAYGNPFTAAGDVNSSVTLGALLAFVNGASEIVVSPLAATSTTPTIAEWTTAIGLLQDQGRVNIVVPLSGDKQVHDAVLSHVNVLFNLGQYRRGFVGRSIGTSAQDLQSQATGYVSSRMVVVGPSKLLFYEGDSNQLIELGGEYAAVAVAAAHASRPVQDPLTRKPIRGFTSIPAQPTDARMIDIQRSGVLWLWEKRNGGIVVRHGLTTNMSNIYTREISIQAAKDRLMALILDTLDAQQLIGSVITEGTPEYVVGAIVGALEQAMADQLIFAYSSVKYRQPTANPTMLQVRFMYKPSLPLNYVHVQFALDTNTGTTVFTEAA